MSRIRFLFLGFILLLFESCADIYTPTTPNVTSFDKKNEFHGEGTICSIGFFNLKTAYSLSNHINIQCNTGLSSMQDYIEGAIGLHNILITSIYNQLSLGYGRGKTDFHDPFTGSDFILTEAKGDYEKIYGQFNFTFNKNEKLLSGLCIRMTDLKFTYSFANFNWLIGNTYEIFYFEPYYFSQVKLDKHLYFLFYGGIIIKSEPDDIIRTHSINLGGGLAFKLFN